MTPWLDDGDVRLYHGDCLDVLRELPDGKADCCVTSPPYLDARPEYPSPNMSDFELIFSEVGRVVGNGPIVVNVGRIHRDGREVLWWADLLLAAQRAGLALRDTLVWVKPNANPIKGPVLADSHEYVFLFGDYFNVDAVRTNYAPSSLPRFQRRWVNGRGVKGDTSDQDGRAANPLGARPRSFLIEHVGREKGNPHPAPMAERVAEHLVLLASWPNETVLDPFAGSGTTLKVARDHGRRSIGIELSEDYCRIAAGRLAQQSLLTGDAA